MKYHPGEILQTEDGRTVHSHGGGMLFHGGRWWWYGEDKCRERAIDGSDPALVSADPAGMTKENMRLQKNDWGFTGVSCFSSADLLHWRDEGIVLHPDRNNPDSPIYKGKTIERPKVLFNPKTGRFVMWMHAENVPRNIIQAGVAVSDSPTGPFQFLKSYRPIDYPEGIPAHDPCRERTEGRTFNDMNVFHDDDGSAYLLYASEICTTLYIARLSEDFTDVERPVVLGKTWARCLPGDIREAPVAFKHDGRYYLLTSGCTGYAPNAVTWASAPSMLGPWTWGGDACVGPEAVTGYRSQPTVVVPVPGCEPGSFLYVGDRWNPFDHPDSRHVMLPFRVDRSRTVRIDWRPSWDFSVFEKRPAPGAPVLRYELLRLELMYAVDGIRLEWEPVPGADLYHIDRNGEELAATTETHYEPPFSLPGVPCSFTVRASNLSGGSSAASNACGYTFQTPRPCYLSDQAPIRSFVGYGVMRNDHNWKGQPLRIGSRIYAKGLWMHSRALAEWDLGGVYSVFHAGVGIDAGEAGGVSRFRVLGDGKVLFESGPVKVKEEPVGVRVDVKGVRILRLETTKEADMIAHAIWGDARVEV